MMHCSMPRWPVLGLLSALIVAGAACQAAPTAAPATPDAPRPATQPAATAAKTAAPAAAAPRGRVIYGTGPSTALQRADPGLANSGGTLTTLWPVFDGLTWVDRTGKVQPALASAWRNVDERTWEFTLGDYTFHNSRRVTVDDVVKTFERYQDPANRLTITAFISNFDRVTRVDDRTVRVTTRTPDPTLPKLIAFAMILPMQEVAAGGDAFWNKPIGSAGFRFESIDYRNQLRFSAMDPGFRTPRGLPNVKDFEIKFITEEATQAAALRTGEVDIAYTVAFDIAQELWRAGFKEIRGTALATWHYILNSFDGPTADRRVRQALNHAVDKNAINQALYAGSAKLDTQLQTTGLGVNTELRPYAYDVARARELLTQAGYPNGFRAPLTQVDILGAKPQGEAVARYLSGVGVDAPIELVDTPTYVQRSLGPPERRSPIFSNIINWERTFEPNAAWATMSSDVPLANGRKWVNEDFDRLYQQAKASFDEARRDQLYKQAARILHEEAPVIFLWQITVAGAMKREISWEPGQFADAFIAKLRRD